MPSFSKDGLHLGPPRYTGFSSNTGPDEKNGQVSDIQYSGVGLHPAFRKARFLSALVVEGLGKPPGAPEAPKH